MTKIALDLGGATRACQNFGNGWSVARTTNKALVCTKNSVSWHANCNSCETWRLLVWKSGGYEFYDNDQYHGYLVSTVPGRYYGGRQPCAHGDNHQFCGKWVTSGMSLVF